LAHLGESPDAIRRVYRTFNANAPAFRAESRKHGD
jgi:hypothetical protein